MFEYFLGNGQVKIKMFEYVASTSPDSCGGWRANCWWIHRDSGHQAVSDVHQTEGMSLL